MSFSQSGGPTTLDCTQAGNLAACDARSLRRAMGTSSSTGGITASAMYVVSGLTAGTYTFTAVYRTTAGGTGTFADRNIIVIPLP